jgi:short-subunit dehydrogenase
MQKLKISFTDIRPGFVATPLLKSEKRYPMLMRVSDVAKDIVRAIERRKRVAIIDWKFRILVGFWRLIPKCIWLRLPIRQ